MKNRFTGCDFCYNEEVPAPYEVATPRPSDPADMCCVMSACVACGEKMATGPDVEGGVATFEEWITAIENGELKGILFYS